MAENDEHGEHNRSSSVHFSTLFNSPISKGLSTIRMHEIPDAIAIPTEALVPEMGVDKVFLYKGGKAHAAEVKTGLRTDSSIQIIDGLNVGDTLITSGTLQLREGLPVKLDTVE